MTEAKKRSSELRKQRNLELLRRMRSGEPLNSIDSKASWYPPRPLISKDKKEMARVYNAPTVETAQPVREASRHPHDKVVRLDVASGRGPAPLGEAS